MQIASPCFGAAGFSVVSLQLRAMDLIETFNFDLFAAAAAAGRRRDASAGPDLTWRDMRFITSHLMEKSFKLKQKK